MRSCIYFQLFLLTISITEYHIDGQIGRYEILGKNATFSPEKHNCVFIRKIYLQKYTYNMLAPAGPTVLKRNIAVIAIPSAAPLWF